MVAVLVVVSLLIVEGANSFSFQVSARSQLRRRLTISSPRPPSSLNSFDLSAIVETLSSITPAQAEEISGPIFGVSLFPYLGFLYFLKKPSSQTPPGVIIAFTSLLSFVFLTIPAAILAKVKFDAGLADVDWLHGSAESLLTVTNLITVLAFRQYSRGNNEIFDLNANNNALIATITLTIVALVPTAILSFLLHSPAIHSPYVANGGNEERSDE